jgi:ubiquinone biosynthesis monooxygenase Coq7
MLDGVGHALATIWAAPSPSRKTPRPTESSDQQAGAALDEQDKRLSAGLMRVNHVGEVCAQALYEGQAATTRDPRLLQFFRQAALEEGDHLAWTRARLDELGARPSVLNPLWYGGAFALGALAGRLGDSVSLGFTVETERQVEEHLAGHLDRLPAADVQSRAIVDVMRRDEVHHGQEARALGAAALPAPVRWAMRAAARVMTTTAYRV